MGARAALVVVGTPIGNLGDMAPRAIDALRDADLIACEDTRHTAKLCEAFEITTPRISYHKFNEARRTQEFRRLFAEGKRIALVSDSGMPGISDPGAAIISAAIADGVSVEVVPGPTAFVTALVVSGLPAERFTFVGFLPPKTTARRKALFELRYEAGTLIFYEAGHRIVESLDDMHRVLGDRPATLCRELTKLHEEAIRAPLDELAERARALAYHGEMVVVVGGCTTGEDWSGVPLEAHVEALARALDVPRKDAIRYAASVRGLDRKTVYKAVLPKEKGGHDDGNP
ncbi:MAG: 16S rRNA (cytidine(1402)-2'-O)-methyltransferase [Verrucomicrobia bacterium]|nr:16S rRNA (cytidine(1402)-2'-O)-methyltransferase [Verrucomicrobiota bacterium]